MFMDELKAQKIWFCWNYETRKGKTTKVPTSAYGTATGTSAEYAHSWATFDEAVAAAKEHGYSGVGFKIPKGYFFLDVDHKDVSDPYVQLLLERFGSYAERSVSGSGREAVNRAENADTIAATDIISRYIFPNIIKSC